MFVQLFEGYFFNEFGIEQEVRNGAVVVEIVGVEVVLYQKKANYSRFEGRWERISLQRSVDNGSE